MGGRDKKRQIAGVKYVIFCTKDIKDLITMLDQHEGEEGEEVLCKHTRTMAKTMTKYYIGDVCWVISQEEYEEFVLPAIAEAFIGEGELTRGGETVGFLTGDASAAGWAQDSGVLGVLRFDDLEPGYQERAEELDKGGYTGFFESEAENVYELSVEQLMAEKFYEQPVTMKDLEEMYGYDW